MNGRLRRAALELHAMPEGDRSWILAALPAPERGSLEVLLSELRDLGIPADAGLLTSAAAERPRKAHDLASTHPERIGALARVLAAEPLGVTRALLAVPSWDGREALLRELDGATRRELASLPAAAAPAPRLQAELLRVLAQRLEKEPARPAPGRLARFRARLAQLRSSP